MSSAITGTLAAALAIAWLMLGLAVLETSEPLQSAQRPAGTQLRQGLSSAIMARRQAAQIALLRQGTSVS